MLCFNAALLYFFVLFKPATAVQITNTHYDGIQTGSPFTVTWTNASGPVTMLLRMGSSTDLSKLNAMAIWVDLTGTSFVWVPGPILPTGPYRIQLADSAIEPVFSPQFELTNVPVTTTSSSTTTSPTPTASSQISGSTPTSSSSTETQSSTPTPTPTPTTSIINSAAQTDSPQPRAHQKTAVKVGIVIALLFLIGLTTYFAISLIRNCVARKKRLSQVSSPPHASGDGVLPKDGDLEHGRGAEMSGALDSAISISAGVSSPTTATIGSRRPSTRPGTGSDIEMVEVVEEPEPEPEPEPVEIGSSGYGKEMSGLEKGKAVELEANQRVKFEERKRRRRGVRLMVGRMKILF